MSTTRGVILWFLLFILGVPLWGYGDTPNLSNDEVTLLRQEVEALKARIEHLEETIQGLATQLQDQAKREELEALLQAAEATAKSRAEEPSPETKTFRGGQRSLQALNPNITLTGDVFGNLTDATETMEGELKDEVKAREFELGIESMLDPFTRFKAFLAIEDVENVELEEGYMEWLQLPLGTRLKVGRFLQQFGELNRWHTHALPQVDLPLAITTLFGEEGLRATGLSLNWAIPRLWASANELTLELTNAENETAFSGEDFDDFALLAFFKNFWELTPSAYFELGLSGILGENDPTSRRDTSVFGTHLTLQWQPLQKGKYRSFIWRSEGFYSDREEATRDMETLSLYSYLEYQLARRWFLGLRYDYVEDPTDDTLRSWQLAPYITFWQSEWVRLRAQFNHFEPNRNRPAEDTVFLQFTWSAGPHKHERY